MRPVGRIRGNGKENNIRTVPYTSIIIIIIIIIVVARYL